MRLSRTLVAVAGFASVVTLAAAAQAAPATTTPAPAPARPAAGAAPAAAPAAQPTRPPITPATNVTDAEVAKYAKAIVKVAELSRALNGAQPTDAQKAEMMAAVTSNGLTLERFQSIGAATQTDKVLKARILVAAAPPSPAGSIGAAVTDAETVQFARAIKAIKAMNPSQTPTPEEENRQKAAITATGMTVDRFQAILTASTTDQKLHARLSLAVAKLG
ncbi:MAG: DUF4168 domain-containing protein [Caulobacteraceae bacterium]|nr:DUF4168 domain-containing protein [Caulobacteraceae bacterium]